MISSNQLDQLDQEEIGNLQYPRNTIEGNMVRDILYGSRENVNFVHEVYRQAFLLSFSHSPAIKKVISVYKDWIQMNVSELPPFLLEPPPSSIGNFQLLIPLVTFLNARWRFQFQLLVILLFISCLFTFRYRMSAVCFHNWHGSQPFIYLNAI